MDRWTENHVKIGFKRGGLVKRGAAWRKMNPSPWVFEDLGKAIGGGGGGVVWVGPSQ